MALRGFEVSDYELSLCRKTGAVYEAGGISCCGVIECTADDGSCLILYFVHNISSAPDNGTEPDLRRGYSCVPISQYPYYVDMLRNEKPVIAILSTDDPNFNGIRTRTEPVGEEEAPPPPASKLKKAGGMRPIKPR